MEILCVSLDFYTRMVNIQAVPTQMSGLKIIQYYVPYIINYICLLAVFLEYLCFINQFNELNLLISIRLSLEEERFFKSLYLNLYHKSFKPFKNVVWASSWRCFIKKNLISPINLIMTYIGSRTILISSINSIAEFYFKNILLL